MNTKAHQYFVKGGESFMINDISAIRGGTHTILTDVGTFYISKDDGKIYDNFPFTEKSLINDENFKAYLIEEVKDFINKKKNFLDFYLLILNELENE